MATMNRDGLLALYEYDAYANHVVKDGLAQLSESDLARDVPIEFGQQPYHLPVWQLLVQAFLHATQHRAELGIVLGQMGRPLPTMDIIVHFMHQSGQPWPPK